MTKPIWTVAIGGLWMQLVESRGNYSIVFEIPDIEPFACSVSYVGRDRQLAVSVFARKVALHRLLMGVE